MKILGSGSGDSGGVQGFLVHKKTPTPLGPPEDPIMPRVLGVCVFV